MIFIAISVMLIVSFIFLIFSVIFMTNEDKGMQIASSTCSLFFLGMAILIKI